jgi:hypothetical protein
MRWRNALNPCSDARAADFQVEIIHPANASITAHPKQSLSFPREQESSLATHWVPAFARMTLFYSHKKKPDLVTGFDAFQPQDVALIGAYRNGILPVIFSLRLGGGGLMKGIPRSRALRCGASTNSGPNKIKL